MNPGPTELGELVAAMATDAIKVRSLWNHAYESEVEQLRAMMEHAPPDSAANAVLTAHITERGVRDAAHFTSIYPL